MEESRKRTTYYKLEYELRGPNPDAQSQLITAACSLDNTDTAAAGEGRSVVIRLKQQRSCETHCRLTIQALTAMGVTSIQCTRATPIPAPKPTLSVPVATSTAIVPAAAQGQATLHMDQEIASAFLENRMHQYVEQRQRQQWGGYILKLQLAPQCFGVAARPVSGAGWQIHVIEYLNINTHTVSDAKRVAESRARFEQEQSRRRAENGHIEDDNAFNDTEPGWIYGSDQRTTQSAVALIHGGRLRAILPACACRGLNPHGQRRRSDRYRHGITEGTSSAVLLPLRQSCFANPRCPPDVSTEHQPGAERFKVRTAVLENRSALAAPKGRH